VPLKYLKNDEVRMEKQASVKKNFIMNAILKMSRFIFPLVTYAYVSRILLAEGMGRVSFASSVISYFSMFAQLGIPTYGIRVCATVRDDKEKLSRTAQELLIINIFTSLISYIALGIAIEAVAKFRSDRSLYIVLSSTIILTSIGMEWLYQALEKYTYITIRSIIFKILALVLMVLMVHSKSDYIIYGALSILAESASNIFNLLYSRHFISLKPVGNYNFRRHFKAIGIFFAMAVASTIYTQMDKTMLGFMAGDREVGFYDAATRIKGVLVGIVTSLGTVLLPRASYYVAKNDMENFKRIALKAIRFVFIISIPLALYFTIYADESIRIISGNGFDGAVIPMQIIMITIIFIGITNILGIQILVPLDHEKKVLYSEIAGALVNLIVNALLIPAMKSAGAAIGTVCAELAVLIYQAFVLRKEAGKLFHNQPYFKLAAGLLIAVLLSWPIKFLGLNAFMTLFLSFIIFFAAYFIVLLLLKEELTKEFYDQIKKRLIKRDH